jgi:serine/threonine protein kinase
VNPSSSNVFVSSKLLGASMMFFAAKFLLRKFLQRISMPFLGFEVDTAPTALPKAISLTLNVVEDAPALHVKDLLAKYLTEREPYTFKNIEIDVSRMTITTQNGLIIAQDPRNRLEALPKDVLDFRVVIDVPTTPQQESSSVSLRRPELWAPPGIQTPSTASEDSIFRRFNFRSPCFHPMGVNCAIWMHSFQADESLSAQFYTPSLCDLFHSMASSPVRCGPWKNLSDTWVNRPENSVTAMVTSFIEKAFSKVDSGIDFHVFHQMADPTTGKIDVLICYQGASLVEYILVAILEFEQFNMTSKFTKTLAYVSNSSITWKSVDDVVLSLEILYDPRFVREASTTVRLSSFDFGHYRMLQSSLIWDGNLDDTSWMRIVKCIVEVARFNQTVTDKGSINWKCSGDNVGIDFERNLVFKSYDYRVDPCRKVRRSSRQRSPTLNVRFLMNCSLELDAAQFRLISYPSIEGSHVASRVLQFVAIIQELFNLHMEDLVHGDIRASNIIFGENSCLIDFDFSGLENVQTYPEFFALKLPDGKRHPDVKPNGLLRKAHDCFSMAAIMEMYTMDEISVWNDAIALVNSCQLEEASEILDEFRDMALIVCTSTTPLEGTGSLEDTKLQGKKRENRDPMESDHSKKAKA